MGRGGTGREERMIDDGLGHEGLGLIWGGLRPEKGNERERKENDSVSVKETKATSECHSTKSKKPPPSVSDVGVSNVLHPFIMFSVPLSVTDQRKKYAAITGEDASEFPVGK